MRTAAHIRKFGRSAQPHTFPLFHLAMIVTFLVADRGADDIESSAAEGVFEGDVSRYEEVSKAVRASGANTIFIATGSRPALDPLGPFNVDYNGTANIVGAASASGKVDRIVLITSIGVDDLLFPLNLFFGVLFWKKRAEEVLQRSGITYTIVRPGGLLDQPRAGSTTVEPIDLEVVQNFDDDG